MEATELRLKYNVQLKSHC